MATLQKSIKTLQKSIWGLIYTFNKENLYRIPSITIASTRLYTETDEYCTLSFSGWVTVRSKKDSKYRDMIPTTLVSKECINLLLKSQVGK